MNSWEVWLPGEDRYETFYWEAAETDEPKDVAVKFLENYDKTSTRDKNYQITVRVRPKDDAESGWYSFSVNKEPAIVYVAREQ